MKAETEAAALHLFIGALEHRLKTEHKGVVVPGHYNLSGLELIASAPPFAAVDRAEGTQKDGYDEIAGEPLPLSPMAERILLREVLTRAGIKPKEFAELCLHAIREAAKGSAIGPQPELLAALETVRKELPTPKPFLRATPRKRTGEKEVVITIRRIKKRASVSKAPAA